jgi:hypothetical protein
MVQLGLWDVKVDVNRLTRSRRRGPSGRSPPRWPFGPFVASCSSCQAFLGADARQGPRLPHEPAPQVEEPTQGGGPCEDAEDDGGQAPRLAAYHAVFLEAVADHELTEAEEATLEHVRAELDIPADDVADEADVLDRLRTLRRIRAGDLPEVTPSRPLQKSETCYYEAPARLLKERNLESFQRDGVRYNVRGYVVDREGTLFVTQKRIVLMHTGSTAYRLSQVRDIEVDADENLIRIVRDGVATATERGALLLTADKDFGELSPRQASCSSA